jgi:hypothetical protein
MKGRIVITDMALSSKIAEYKERIKKIRNSSRGSEYHTNVRL